MKKRVWFVVLLSVADALPVLAQMDPVTAGFDTASMDLKVFATKIVVGATDNFERASVLLKWLGDHFEWKATDYRTRTVKEIMARKGGNCFELATLYMALLKELNIRYRPIAEVNLHRKSEERERNAERMIRERGNEASVFGREHNDHRWVEIFDERSGEWVPADATMNIIGLVPWLRARVWFGPRHTINDEFSGDMVVPVAIFVVDRDKKDRMVENRTDFYLIDRFDGLYDHRLSQLPSWGEWVHGIRVLSKAAKNAFEGMENLHDRSPEIAHLVETYQRLKEEFLAADAHLK
jgi:hypothetical protein